MKFEDIKQIGKAKWKAMIKRSITEKSLERLNVLKMKHSKVDELKHTEVKMQSYLLPNEVFATKNEIELIFKMRCRVTHVKMNLKGLYDTYECGVCLKEDESQEHIYKCKEIWKTKDNNGEQIPEYGKIKNGNTKEKLQIARIFKQNMKVQETFQK